MYLKDIYFTTLKSFTLLISLLFIASCGGGDDNSTPSNQNDGYSVSGKVIDSAYSKVLLIGEGMEREIVSNEVGYFEFTEIGSGNYVLHPVSDNKLFTPVSITVEVRNSNVNSLNFEIDENPDALASSILENIETIPDSYLSDQEIILPNGKSLHDYAVERGLMSSNKPKISSNHSYKTTSSIEEIKNDAIATMLLQARDFACARKNPRCTKWDFNGNIENENQPSQKGLTYVYGGKKNPNSGERSRPVDGCQQETIGMDCSGLIHLIAGKAGLIVPVGTAATQSDPKAWNIPGDWGLDMKPITDGIINAGDIITWKGHIGIAESAGNLKDLKSFNVISSTGRPKDCTKNISPPRGPRSLPASVFGTPTKVLRLSEDKYYYMISYNFTSDPVELATAGTDSVNSSSTGTGVEHCQDTWSGSDSSSSNYPVTLFGEGMVDNLCFINGAFVPKEISSTSSTDSGEGNFVDAPYETAPSNSYMRCSDTQSSGTWTSKNIHISYVDSAGDLTVSKTDEYGLNCNYRDSSGSSSELQTHNTKFNRMTKFNLTEQVESAIDNQNFGSSVFESVVTSGSQLVSDVSYNSSKKTNDGCNVTATRKSKSNHSVSRDLKTSVSLNIRRVAWNSPDDLPEECKNQ